MRSANKAGEYYSRNDDFVTKLSLGLLLPFIESAKKATSASHSQTPHYNNIHL
jgi:hypothetical protein